MKLHDFGTTIMIVLLTLLVIDKVDRHLEEERERKNYVCVEYFDDSGIRIMECETSVR